MTEEKSIVSDKALSWQPNFIGIGTMKAASAWLFQCICEHPEISGTNTKEVHFFDLDVNFGKGLQHYQSFFSAEGITGEFSPSYLYESAVPSRIHSCFPSVKLIACLRDPADRAWSHYRYAIQMHGRLSVYSTFKEAYTQDESLAGMGRYAEQLERYLQLFQEDQIKILFYEDLIANPLESVQSIYHFLDVKNPMFTPKAAAKRRNQTGDRVITHKYKRSWALLLQARRILQKFPALEGLVNRYGIISNIRNFMNKSVSMDRSPSTPIAQPRMSRTDRQMVIDHLSDDITKLERLTGRDLSCWKKHKTKT